MHTTVRRLSAQPRVAAAAWLIMGEQSGGRVRGTRGAPLRRAVRGMSSPATGGVRERVVGFVSPAERCWLPPSLPGA
ncbi:hypothetical protein ACFYQT_41450 [Streptomyces tibetensis]|uniref:Secreted protein n=1 Tax=Streptomyces tibetensis TaxID=2382123 RepID=A0ABW6N962_9ACTN